MSALACAAVSHAIHSINLKKMYMSTLRHSFISFETFVTVCYLMCKVKYILYINMLVL